MNMTTSAPFTVTFFYHHSARAKREMEVTLAELCEMIETQTAERKDLLPWIKLAIFGNLPTNKGSLRHDANVKSITGCEADYDGELISFDEGKAILEKAGIEAIIYTSPSHLPDKPRYRILCRFSERLKPEHRAQMVARLNGLFHGVLAAESFTLSQSYYYGHVVDADGNPVAHKKNGAGIEEVFPTEYRRDLIEGQPLDLCDELDRGAISKSGGRGGDSGDDPRDRANLEELVRRIKTGESLHPSVTSIAGKCARRDWPIDACIELIGTAFTLAGQPRYGGRWAECLKAIHDIYDKEEAKRAGPGQISFDDFYVYAPEHKFIFKPTGKLWPQATVNARLPVIAGIKPSAYIDRNQPVDQMTWAPGEDELIKGKLIIDGGWIERTSGRVYNLYRGPRIRRGSRDRAQPWIDHVHNIYPSEANHILQWLACRAQRPQTKINHALVLGGAQGIGKDTLLEPARHAVGYWNCATVSPPQLVGRFNSFLKSILLIISEARDLGEINRPNFYEHTKAIIAAPPDVLLVDEKNTHPYYIPNLCGVIITTNHKSTGIYLPAEDRRHYVAWSAMELSSFDNDYWHSLWGFYLNGGFEHVAAYLMTLDISTFDPKEPPARTDAFHEIVTGAVPGEIGELADALALLGYPNVVTLGRIADAANADFALCVKDRRNRRLIPRWMEGCGYIIVANPFSKQGLWQVSDKQQIIYAKAALPAQTRLAEAQQLARG